MKRLVSGLCLLIVLLWSPGALAAQVQFPGAHPPDASVQRGMALPPAMPSGVAGARYMKAGGVSTQAAQTTPDAWRLRVREATIAPSRMVTLGDIADPLGAMPPEEWRMLAAQELWPAPDEAGKPMQINKARLAAALREVLGSLSEQIGRAHV